MEVLWLAILIYSLGLAAVLHLRPALMFHPNGTWKEFGYQRASGHTLFPFWLFSVAWAFVSYAIAMAASAVLNTGAATAAVAATSYNTIRFGADEGSAGAEESDEESGEELEMEPVAAAPRPRGRPRGSKNKPRPGYYVLDPASRDAGGLRRYVYYGEQPPPADE
jgi:hypothetical protein